MRIQKQTKTRGGRERYLTVPLMLNKSCFYRKNYNTGDRGNLLINVVGGNAFITAKRFSAHIGELMFENLIVYVV